MKEIPANVSESTKKRNPNLYPSMYSHPGFCGVEVAEAIKSGKPPTRIRQSTKPLMNELEKEWAFVLHERYGQFGLPVFPQSIRFMLANGVWYKPDFVVFGETGMMAFECKGPHSFRGGMENLKIAANKYAPRVKFALCWKVDGQWQEQTVLP